MTDQSAGEQRQRAPLAGGAVYLSDGGLETFLIFERDIELPEFAAFLLLTATPGEPSSATKRAPIRSRSAAASAPRATATPRRSCSPPARCRTTTPRVAGSFVEAGADLVGALTITYVEEGIGGARAAAEAGIPAMVSFTVGTDGRLPSGQALGEAIDQVDGEAGTDVAYFGINCAHPTHLQAALHPGAPWIGRIAALRANASLRSHAELDAGDRPSLAASTRSCGPCSRT